VAQSTDQLQWFYYSPRVITVKTDASKKGTDVLLRRWSRRIGKHRTEAGWNRLQICGVEVAILNTGAKNGIIRWLLPDLLRLRRKDSQLRRKIFLHGDAMHGRQFRGAGHRGNVRSKCHQRWLGRIGEGKRVVEPGG